MRRKELIAATVRALRQSNARKPVKIAKHAFHITDCEGNTARFTVKEDDRLVNYNAPDVENVLDALISVIEDSLRRGEEVNIHGFGVFSLKYRETRSTRNMQTGEYLEIPGRFLPKFAFGNRLRMAARMYELNKEDIENAPKRMEPVYEEDDEDQEADD